MAVRHLKIISYQILMKRGQGHRASFYAKIIKGLKYNDLDKELVRQAKQKFGEEMKGKVMDVCLNSQTQLTPENLLVLEVIGKSCFPEKYEYEIKGGHLFQCSRASSVLASIGKRSEINHDFNSGRFEECDIKVWLEQGFLRKDDEYSVEPSRTGNKQNYGFCLDVDNNDLVKVTKYDCESFRGTITDLIDSNYKEFIQIVNKSSV